MGRKKRKNTATTFEEAKQRYMAGICPDCSAKMQHRKELADFFCHKCHKSWTFKKIEEKFGVKPVATAPVTAVRGEGRVVPKREEAEAKKRFSSVSSWLFWKKFQKK